MQEIIKYQEIDIKIKKLNAELKANANGQKALEMQQFLKDVQTKLVSLDENAKALSQQYDKSVAVYNEFIKKLDNLVKEVDTAGGEKAASMVPIIEKFSSDAEKLDNHISSLQGRMNAVSRDVKNLVDNAVKARHNRDIYKAEFDKEREKIEPQINALKSELAKQRAKVSPELLAKYDAKADGKMSEVFVPEINGKCKGCRMEISAGKMSLLNSNGIIECENCGRYIYK